MRNRGSTNALPCRPSHKNPEEDINVFFQYDVKTDAQGRFVFERVIPGPASVSRSIQISPHQFGFGAWVSVNVDPGKTAQVNVGGTGRPVVGRAVKPPGQEIAIDWSNGQFLFRLQPPPINEPPNMTREQRAAWYKTWATTAEGKAYLAWQENPRIHGFAVARDGSFRIDDVAAGTYNLSLQLYDGQRRRAIATIKRTVVVPAIPGGRSDEPLDLGELELKASP